MKHVLLFLIAIAISSLSFAALTGTKTIPGDYASVALAITDLNTQGVGAGGVTFNVAAGYTETLTAPLSITATGTSADQVIFQKSGSGANPLITAYVGISTPGSAIQDGLWNLVGSDYVTIDGIDLYDPNSTNPATMEYGYAMFKASVTDGCHYNTIKNCVVTLSRVNNATGTAPAVDGSRAINVMNSLVSTQTTAVTPTSAAGTNSYNKFYSNTLQNCNIGLAIIGYAAATPFTLGDTGNDIGGTLSTTGNSILNFGGAAAAANPAAGIRVNNQWGINITYNTINNNNGSGVNHPLTLRGIYAAAGTSANATITHNNVTIAGGGTTSSIYGIDNGIGSTAASNTVDISYNSVSGSYSTATTGAFYAFQNSASAATVNVTYNTVSGISTPGTGAIYGMTLGSPTVLNVNNNSVTSITKTGIGAIYGIQQSTATVTNQYNTIDGLSCTAASSTASIYGIYDGGSAVLENYSNNIVKNISTTGTATIYGIYINTATGNKTIQNNQLFNFTVAGGGTIYGVTMSYGSTDVLSDNQIHDLTITGATSGTIYGLRIAAGTLNSVYNNNINTLSCAGGTAGAIYGLYIATGTTNNVYKNMVYNLSSGSTGPSLYGAYLVSGTTNNFYNNFISDLRTPAANSAIPLAGVYVSGGTTANVFYNTVYLNATSTGALFGSAALYASTTPTLDMRNNVLVNVSTPMGTGVTAAYRRGGATLTSYSANSNANAFYAGATEDATHAVYFDGTTPYDIAAYKTLVGPSRDAVSFRELPPFTNVAATPYDLHMLTSVPTYCESGALAIVTPIAITDDFDGNTRTGTPDVGADEFAGIAAGVVNPGGFAATVISSQQINLGFTLNPSSNNVAIVWNATGTFTAPVGAPPAIGDPFAGGTLLSYGTTSPVSHTGLTPATPYYYKAFSYDGSNYSAGSTATATPSVAPPTAFTATAATASQINLAYTLNAQANNVVIATAATATFGTPVNGTALNVSDPISGGGTVIYVGPLAAFNHTGLTASTAYFYKVWSVDAFAYYSATGATANATTPCADISAFPFTESFAATLGCWSYSEAVAGATVHWGTATADATHGAATAQSGAGTYFARIDIYNAATAYNPYYFTSPSFTLDATAKQVKYYYWLGATGYTLTPVPLTLQVSTNGGNTWTDLYAHTSANSVFGTASTSPWTLNTVSLAAYTGTTVKFRFVSYSNYGSGFTNQGIDEFVIEDIPSCPAPTTLTATNVTTSSADLGWTASATNYDIEYGPAGFTQGTGTTVLAVSNPYTLSGLTSNTAYGYYVRGNCPGSLVSPWAGPKTFTTLCGSTVVPFTENFDSYTVPAYGCGTVIDQNADNVKWVTATGTPYNGLNKLHIAYSAAGVAMDDWYMTQGLDLTGGQSYDVKFYYKGGSSSYVENLEMKWGAAPTAAGMTSAAIFSDLSFYKAAYTLAAASFTPATTGTYFIGLHCFSIGDQLGIDVDQINIIATPSCPAPLTVTASAVTSTTVAIGWTGVAPNVQIDYGTVGHTAGTGTLISTSTNPQSISSLTPSTSYDVFVRQDCGSGVYSTWTGPITFTTACAAVSAFNENFDAVTVPALPSCWAKYISPSFTYETVNTYATGPNSSPNCVQLYSSGALLATDAPMLISPSLTNLSSGTYQLHFFAKGVSTNLSVIVGTMSDPANSATFTPFATVTGLNTSTYTEKAVSFASYAGTDTYIAFQHPLTTTYSYVYLDNISWELIPACPAPTTLTATPGNFFANLGWTAGGSETSWDIEWGASGFAQGTGTIVTGVTNPYTLTGLSASTAYAYYVRANCGSGSYSTWSGPKTFTTLVACPVPTALTATNLTKTTADLTWTENGSATTWNLEYGPVGFTQGTGTSVVVTSLPYTVSGLTAGTAYAFYVQSDCGSGTTSTWAGPTSFVTVCGDINTYPWTEGFEGIVTVGSKLLPPCWTWENVVGTSGPTSSATTGSYYGPHAGSKFIYTTYANTTWVYTPGMELTAGTSYDFSFWMMNKTVTSPIDFLMDVAYGSTNSSAGMTNVLASAIECSNNSYVQFKYSFTPATSGVYYMGVKTTSATTTPWYVSFDDFRFEPTPACVAPTGLTVSGLTTTGASVAWTGATTAQIEFGAVGHTAGTGTISASTTTNPYSISGLTAATSYDVYVRQDCGSGSLSPWFGPVTFTTLCNAFTLPFSESFPTAASPTCWSEQLAGAMTASHWSNVNSAIAGGTAYEARATYSPGQGAVVTDQDRLVTPALNTTGLTALKLSFRQMLNDYNAGVNDVWVKVQSSADGINWTDEWTYNAGLGVSIPAEVKNLTITNNLGGTTYIAFTLAGYTYDINYWYIDDVLIMEQPAVDLAFTSFYQGSSSLAPTLGNANSIVSHSKHAGEEGEFTALRSGIAGTPASNVNNTVVLPNTTSGSSKYPTVPVEVKALVTNEGLNAASYNLNWTVDGVSQPAYAGPSIAATGTDLATISYTPTARGTFISSGTLAVTGDGNLGNNSNSFRMRVYPDVFTRKGYDRGDDVVDTYVGWGATTPAMKAGVRFTATSDIKLAGVDFVFRTEAVTTGTVTVEVRAAGTTTTAPGAVLYTMNYNAAAYLPSGEMGDVVTFPFGDDAPVIASGSDYWITIKAPEGVLYPGGCQGSGFTAGRSFYENTDLATWSALVITTEYAWMMRSIDVAAAVNKTLSLKVLLEGSYNGAGGLNKAQGSAGDEYPGTTADKVTVELHDGTTGALVYTLSNVDLSTTGMISGTIPAAHNGSYYIYVRHRNSVTTSTAAPVTFAGSTISYDFSTGIAQAFGSNMKDVSGVAVFFGGDENQDGIVESTDMIDCDNDAAAFAGGYILTDINGDGVVDSSDMIIIDNNNTAFVGAVLPF